MKCSMKKFFSHILGKKLLYMFYFVYADISLKSYSKAEQAYPPLAAIFEFNTYHYLSFKIIELIQKYEICCKPHAFTRGHCYMYIYYTWTIQCTVSGGSAREYAPCCKVSKQ